MIAVLNDWLYTRLSTEARAWFDGQRGKLREGYSDRTLHITLGLIPRRLGKQDLAPSPAELSAAQEVRRDWNPDTWSVADAARVLVLLETADRGNQAFSERFTDLCRSADVAEQIAYYRGLPLYPDATQLQDQAAEGLRTNIRTVFEAVAHWNPYPRDYFGQGRWNQMVLKALFVDSRLDPIVGLDQRSNLELAHIMCDYAHERWAAGRDVSPELWRCVGPHATATTLDDLARAYASQSRPEALAGGLALQASPTTDQALTILQTRPELLDELRQGDITWRTVWTLLT